MSIEPAKKLEVKEAADLAAFYGVPQSLVNLYFIDMGGTIYPKEAFYLKVAAKKGYQRIETKADQIAPDDWVAECKVYPIIPRDIIAALSHLDKEERTRLLDYYTAPTNEAGHANKQNVRMSTMHIWLREMAVKRAVCRALRKFSGVDLTAYEELPEAELSAEQVKEVKAAS